MKIILKNLPNEKTIFKLSRKVQTASERGHRWETRSINLGDDKMNTKCGVYIFCNSSKILYVGKTVRDEKKDSSKKLNFATFGERLRRHLQMTSSGSKKNTMGSKTHQNLMKHKKNLRVFFIPREELNDILSIKFSNSISDQRKALLLEQILIIKLKPEFNKN